MNIQIIDDFPQGRYYHDKYDKKRICLHHTCGGTAKSSIDWWRRERDDKGNQKENVATAYIIDRDGTIYNVFNDRCWAFQFGLKGYTRRLEMERESIGIELANWGELHRDKNGVLKNCYDIAHKGAAIEKPWHGKTHWEPYKEAQYAALNELLPFLAQKHKITLRAAPSPEYDLNVFDEYTLITHSNVNPDKTDLSPVFDWSKLVF
jgi:N-acetyl-anhydromuramyl-L-alanine amidase AmpD